jgi:bifunctional non-homologous end joining protein LigD
MSLGAYTRKRDFTRTKEPAPAKKTRSAPESHRFVIQKHDASRLHYDFRLEIDGALKSWAVPKGVPFEKGEKHLAVQVEDHPLEYAGFEGIIPKGQYGGGTVMVWDEGAFECLGGDPAKDLEAGKLHFSLEGRKLKGEWTLIRIKGRESHDWLLLKSGESTRPIGAKKDNESAVSGRTMAQIAKDQDAEWQSNRAEPKTKATTKSKAKPETKTKAKTNDMPAFIEPMKATLLGEPPADGDWIYELKFDGYRALAMKSGDSVRLFSSNAKDFTTRFAEITEGISSLKADSAILDGEIVALDEEGRSSFQLLQAIELGEERPPIVFYVFDLLSLDGVKCMDQPLRSRRERLAGLLRDAPEPIRYSAEIEGDPRRLLKEIARRGLEGIMGKERDSVYEPGRRSRAWIKLKCIHEQEFVIGGYTPPEGTRSHFGALLVGYYEKDELRFAGKVGTGFNQALLKSLHRKLQALARESCPFTDMPGTTRSRWSKSLGSRETLHWVEPRIVCQLKFTEWTRDGKLRHPVFLGVREDKDAREVVRERPAPSKRKRQ